MVALLECALRGDRRRSLVMAAAVVPCVLVVVLLFHHGGTADALTSFVRNLGLCLLAIAAGDWLRARREAAERPPTPPREQERCGGSARSGCRSPARSTTSSPTR